MFMSWPVTCNPWAARWQIQFTIGKMSLNRVTCVPVVMSHTSSVTSHMRRSPAISRSEFVKYPPCLVFVMWMVLLDVRWPF